MNHNGSAANNKRDISHFLLMRVARQDDDKQVGELLLRAFEQTYRYKLPEVFTNRQRKIELMDVESRREEGVVYVLELGYRIIGTFALMQIVCRLSRLILCRCSMDYQLLKQLYVSTKKSKQILKSLRWITGRWMNFYHQDHGLILALIYRLLNRFSFIQGLFF